MLDVMTTIGNQVQLWRIMQSELGVGDALYRGILARVRTPSDRRELNEALGLRSMDSAKLDEAIVRASNVQDRVRKLRELRQEWPDDFALALALLDALEDAREEGAARALALELRRRPDADARVLTDVGEFYLRLAAGGTDARRKAEDEASARRAFGEIVEFAPTDPTARRRLGDLLRSHGWFEEARRQYETLQELTPDDASVPLLVAAAAVGQGRLEEAVRWTEKGGGAGSPDVDQGPAVTARIFATTFLGWGRLDARQGQRSEELLTLRARAERLLAKGDDKLTSESVRVSLMWSHPDFHPSLWTNSLGAPMPAAAGDMTMGVAEAVVPLRPDAFVEVHLDPSEVEHAARLGVEAVLTVAFHELEDSETILRLPLRWERGGQPIIRFYLQEGTVRRGE
jgi:Ca-activated chloride channel family protein